MFRKTSLTFCVMLMILWFIGASHASSLVTQEGDKTYIVDQLGERWDVTQAKSIGFRPEWFQFGIGRDAFTPLDDSELSEDTSSVPRRHRIIGVVEGSEARAYSVDRLWRHEFANSKIASKPIAVGY